MGNSSAKTDRKETLAGYGDLSNLFNFGINSGKSATTTAQNFFQQLTSGNRTVAQQAIAPERNQLTAASDAQKREQATSGTARGGGTAPLNQTRDTDVAGTLDNLLFGARTGAAKELGALGTKELDTAGTAGQDLTADSIKSRIDSYKINKDTQQNIANFSEAAMKFAFGF